MQQHSQLLEQARRNMLKQQVHTAGIVDEKILALLAKVPREDFVPSHYKELAYADVAIPLSANQSLLPSDRIAQILQALAIQASDKALVVGVESGYVTALLANLVENVYVIDGNDQLLEQAHLRLQQYKNVQLLQSDPTQGWTVEAPYDVIFVTGSMQYLPINLRNQLAIAGRIFVIIGDSPVMEATIVKQSASNKWQLKKLFETNWPRLPTVEELPKFTF